MPRVEDGKPYAWGRLYAALGALDGLAAVGRVTPVPEEGMRRTVGKPRTVCEEFLSEVGDRVFTARQKGGVVAEAAAVVFADVGRLILPEPMARHGLAPDLAEAFRQGYEAQLAEYRKQWEGLVD
ncbi:hypothetical protein ACFY8P_04040 [Streptomyces sp. NPDC012693]|uniref:hypothetical protein n=1 Tax=Streptomyces sp. NPDC012693 TaxID=3364844 RepID=UPI003693D5DC